MNFRLLILSFCVVQSVNANESKVIKEKEYSNSKKSEIEERFEELNHSPGACLVRYIEAYRYMYIEHCKKNNLHHRGPTVKTDKGYKTKVVGGGCEGMSMSHSVLHTAVK